MSSKKSARDAITSFVSRSLRQELKILLGKVKHLGNKADLSFKLSASNPSWYKNMDTSSNKKLEHEMSKNMGYGAGSKSDGPLNSCTNISKAKCFNFDMVKTLSLSSCDFGSTIDDVNIDLPLSIFLESPLCLVASVKKKICFELTKSFALNISLLAVSRSTLYDKLKSVRKLFYIIDGFESVSTPLKFSDIVRASFISDFSLILAKQLAVSKNLVVNTDLKKISI
ncbi:hypothetical protein G9A89_014136 [Geosiphon pyriformis]|nr:hypothetical protein G9A89_014136 [Geosiphon pyriformis]